MTARSPSEQRTGRRVRSQSPSVPESRWSTRPGGMSMVMTLFRATSGPRFTTAMVVVNGFCTKAAMSTCAESAKSEPAKRSEERRMGIRIMGYADILSTVPAVAMPGWPDASERQFVENVARDRGLAGVIGDHRRDHSQRHCELGVHAQSDARVRHFAGLQLEVLDPR